MPRRSRNQTLTLWINGDYVGKWTISANGDSELEYDPSWQASARGRPLSLSLPFNDHGQERTTLKGSVVDRYFDNLLSENSAVRIRVAERFRTGSIEPIDLLGAIGRDCIGALQLLPEGQLPTGIDRIEGVDIDESGIEQHLSEVVSPTRLNANPSSPEDDFRISLAGAQEKDAFLFHNGRWMKPRGATPTTHIFKLPLGFVGGRRVDFRSSVDNEWLCLKLLAAYGLSTPSVEIATFGKHRVLVVERFDRRLATDGNRLLRLVQEDFCQATGTSALTKYESEGGPGLKKLFEILSKSSERSLDFKTLMSSQILFWMLRAPDGHAKNFSIHLLPRGRYHLTPIYDVMSAYPIQGDGPNQWSKRELKLAMALLGKNRHYEIERIQRRHFTSTADQVGYGESVEPLIDEIIAKTPQVIESVQRELPPDFSQEVLDTVLGGLQSAAQSLEEMGGIEDPPGIIEMSVPRPRNT